MRTTLDLPDPLLREAKNRAIQQGVKLKELLTAYIEAGMRVQQAQETYSARNENRHPLPVGWEGNPSEPSTPNRTNAELYAILDQEDVENFHRVSRQSPPTP